MDGICGYRPPPYGTSGTPSLWSGPLFWTPFCARTRTPSRDYGQVCADVGEYARSSQAPGDVGMVRRALHREVAKRSRRRVDRYARPCSYAYAVAAARDVSPSFVKM